MMGKSCKAVDKTQAELHSLKFETLDACIAKTPFRKSNHIYIYP